MPSMVNVRKTEEKGNKKRRTVIKLICWNKKQEKNDYTFTSAVLWHFCIGDDTNGQYTAFIRSPIEVKNTQQVISMVGIFIS